MGPSKSRSSPHAQAASPIVIYGCSLARHKISHYRAPNTIGVRVHGLKPMMEAQISRASHSKSKGKTYFRLN